MLIVEDTISERHRYATLASDIMTVKTASTLEEAKGLLDRYPIDILITDIHLTFSLQRTGFEGFEVIKYTQKNHPKTLILAMSSDPKIETYQKALQLGARYFIKKPILSADELKVAIEMAKDRRYFARKGELAFKRAPMREALMAACEDGLVLDQKTRDEVRGISRMPHIAALLYGETGTGKEEVAKLAHKYRIKYDKNVPFVAINCANLSPETACSRLFGHKKGSFTGADATTTGYVGEADGGILFLDEIHRLDMSCQAHLLRVLNDGTYERFGDSKPLHSTFQVIAATTQNLDQLVEEGLFLVDLRNRLFGYEMELKPLRERKEDFPLLIELFFAKNDVVVKEPQLQKIIEKCQSYYWQGNIRQLYTVLRMLVGHCEINNLEISADYLGDYRFMHPPKVFGSEREEEKTLEEPIGGFKELCDAMTEVRPLSETRALFEELATQKALEKYSKKVEAAKALGIGRTSFDRKYKSQES